VALSEDVESPSKARGCLWPAAAINGGESSAAWRICRKSAASSSKAERQSGGGSGESKNIVERKSWRKRGVKAVESGWPQQSERQARASGIESGESIGENKKATEESAASAASAAHIVKRRQRCAGWKAWLKATIMSK
jgi:hypothetical protein